MQILIQNLKRIIFNFSPKNIFLLHKISLFLNLKGKIIYFRGSKYTKIYFSIHPNALYKKSINSNFIDNFKFVMTKIVTL